MYTRCRFRGQERNFVERPRLVSSAKASSDCEAAILSAVAWKRRITQRNETTWGNKSPVDANDIWPGGCDDVIGAKPGRLVAETNGPAGWRAENGCGLPHGLRRSLHAGHNERYPISARGNPAEFKRYNAKMVQATGIVSETPPDPSRNNVLSQQPPTLTVSNLKKVADGCN